MHATLKTGLVFLALCSRCALLREVATGATQTCTEADIGSKPMNASSRAFGLPAKLLRGAIGFSAP